MIGYLLLIVGGIFLFVMSIKAAELQSSRREENRENISAFMSENGFNTDKEIKYIDPVFMNRIHVYIDNSNKKLMFFNEDSNKQAIIEYKNILGMETQEDGVKTNGIGRAVVGGVLLGGVGAVVGAVTGNKTIKNVKFIIYLNDILNPKLEINITHNQQISSNSSTYRNIMNFKNDLESTLGAIIAHNENNKASDLEEEKTESVKEDIGEEPLDYFMMELTGKKMIKILGKWFAAGKAVNYQNAVGKYLDLYDGNLQVIGEASISGLFDDHSNEYLGVNFDVFNCNQPSSVDYIVEKGKPLRIDSLKEFSNKYSI